MLSDTVILALVAGVPATIASITAALIAFRSNKATAEISKKVDDGVQMAEDARKQSEESTRIAEETSKVANEKIDHVIVLTNSTLSAANARVAALEKLVETLLLDRSKESGAGDVLDARGFPPALSQAIDLVQTAKDIQAAAKEASEKKLKDAADAQAVSDERKADRLRIKPVVE